MDSKAFFMFFLSILFFLFQVQWLPTATRSEIVSSKNCLVSTSIVINESQCTWYGDFIVNETDTVIIKDCNFTVENGYIFVYGNLSVQNSTIQILPKFKYWWGKFIKVFGFGNLTLFESIIKGRCRIIGYDNSRVLVFNSSVSSVSASMVNITDSTFSGAGGTELYIQNSNGEGAGIDTLPQSTQIISDSNITQIQIIVAQAADLELRPGYVENLTFSNQYWIHSICNSFVEGWLVYQSGQALRLVNSTIIDINLDVLKPFGDESVVLKLNSGFIETQNLYIENNFNITVINSTVTEFMTYIATGNVRIQDSNISLYCTGAPNVSICNSTMKWLAISSLSGNVSVFDCTANSLMLGYTEGSRNFTLQDGYQDYKNFYNEEENSNVTVVRTIVNHWGVETFGNASVSISNSNITGFHWAGVPFAGLNLGHYGSIIVHNSTLTGASTKQFSSLVLINSTLDMLHAYENSNVTAINSTIGSIFTEPASIELINSVIFSRIELPFVMSNEELLTASILDDCDVPLPQGISRTGEYLHIVTTYDDLIKARVRIYYNQTEIEKEGIDETRLQMYYLNESNMWQSSPIQGINTDEDYVWANVTHFSWFVLGSGGLVHDLAVFEVVPSRNIIGQGYCVYLNIIIINQGDFSENFNVTLYVNTTIIEVQNITLTNRNDATVIFIWNTTGVAKGNYTITAKATILPGETDTTDNTLTDGWVIVAMIGDITGPDDYPDGKCDMRDVGTIAKLFGVSYPDPRYDPNCDINDDLKIDMKDIGTVAKHFGETDP